MHASRLIGLLTAFAPLSGAVPLQQRAGPSIELPYATLVGRSLLGVELFSGIPYAQPPVGQLRLKPPKAIEEHLGLLDVSTFAPSCPQQFISTPKLGFEKFVDPLLTIPFLDIAVGQEDCLTMTVQRPSGTTADDKLPVLFWIYGGAFAFGGTSLYDGTILLNSAKAMGKPFIFVTVNYRLGGFGFLPGKEILADGSANLGLLDQRAGLEWVADNIAKFGGDPDKVVIWGQSAGAISVFDQMALYNGDIQYKGKDLFRGAIMNSGSMVPADPVDCPKGQEVYRRVVEHAGCADKEDSLRCLRDLPYDDFHKAVNSLPSVFSYNSVALSYLPRPDGKVLTDSPDDLVKQKKYAKVPFIIGDQDDEGTLFSLFQSNITNAEQITDYLQTLFFNNADKATIRSYVETYPEDIVSGSPFGTGILNAISKEYKRIAAILGDLVFTLTRRVFLENALAANPDVPSWSYLATYYKATPVLGSFHSSDILAIFYGLTPLGPKIQEYYFNFLYELDPNGDSLPVWPQWKDGKHLTVFGSTKISQLTDNFRNSSAVSLAANSKTFRI